MNYEDLKLEKQLCHKFYVLSNKITRRYRPLLNEIGLTYPQYVVLMALWEKCGINVCDLVEKTKIDGGSLSLILDKLKSKSLISCASSKEDKRKKVISLTTKGAELKEKALQIPQKLSCSITNFSPEEFEQLSNLIDKFNDAIPTESK